MSLQPAEHRLCRPLAVIGHGTGLIFHAEKQQSWEALNLELLRHLPIDSGINFGDADFLSYLGRQLVPLGLQGMTVAALGYQIGTEGE